jgi:hypothetical protein
VAFGTVSPEKKTLSLNDRGAVNLVDGPYHLAQGRSWTGSIQPLADHDNLIIVQIPLATPDGMWLPFPAYASLYDRNVY